MAAYFNDDNSSLVYSTGSGRKCSGCGESPARCQCKKGKSGKPVPQNDGIVRVRREVKGRKGKTVTTITGIPLSESGILEVASDLKRSCGTGGSVKDRVIIIQGDRVKDVIPKLEAKGYTVKRSGG